MYTHYDFHGLPCNGDEAPHKANSCHHGTGTTKLWINAYSESIKLKIKTDINL